MPFAFPTPPTNRGGPPRLPEYSPSRTSIWANTLSTIDDRKLSLPYSITSDSDLEPELNSMNEEDEFDALKQSIINYKVDSAEEDVNESGDLIDHESLANYRFGSSVSTVPLSLPPVASLPGRIDDPNLPLYLRRGRGAASFLHISESTRSSQSSSGKGSGSGSDESRDIYPPQSEEEDNEPLTARPGNHLSFSAARRASMQAMRSKAEPEVRFNPWKARRSSISGTPVNGRRPSILPFNFEDLSIHEQELPRKQSIDMQDTQPRQPFADLTNTGIPRQPRLHNTLIDVKPIPALIGPEALPYAHNPSGVNAYQFSGTNLLQDSLFWPSNQQDLASSMRASVYNQTQRTPSYDERANSQQPHIGSQPYIRNPPRSVSGYTPQPEIRHHRTRRGQRSEAKQVIEQMRGWSSSKSNQSSFESRGILPMLQNSQIVDRQSHIPPPPAPVMPHLMPRYAAPIHTKTADELHLLSLLEQLGDFERKGKFLAERVGQLMANGQPTARPVPQALPQPAHQMVLPMLPAMPQSSNFAPQYTAPAPPPSLPFFSLPGGSRPVAVLAPVVEEEEMRSSQGPSFALHVCPERSSDIELTTASLHGTTPEPPVQITQQVPASTLAPRPTLPDKSSSDSTVTLKGLASSTDTVKAPAQRQESTRHPRQNSKGSKRKPRVFADQENTPQVTTGRKPLPGINRALQNKTVNTPAVTGQRSSVKGKGRV